MKIDYTADYFLSSISSEYEDSVEWSEGRDSEDSVESGDGSDFARHPQLARGAQKGSCREVGCKK
jgi:hypothetical protein